ncbi:putative EF-hand-like domain protein [Trachipleistophora hominis]|uniref:Putative EF-hand-like domain protein n=1 Tax=Trachipleistophora hominis TaxID=72359 RepID=L7JV41_TRAHO|nr:putative EF-hand-like domain protein [Trachipleistophora hominis]
MLRIQYQIFTISGHPSMSDKEIDEKFKLFDFGEKGYLTPEEYKAFCYSMLKRPKKIKSNQIHRNDIADICNEPKDYTGYFEFLSDNGKYITYDTMKKALAKLNITDDDIREMITYFNEQGVLSYNEFVKIFE